MMAEPIFPKVKKQIIDFLYEEEGSIPRNKMLMLGSMMLLLSMFYVQDAFAGHRSHSSHSSHKSHSSHSSSSHSSHGSHSNSHSSHSNATPRPTPKPTPTPVPIPAASTVTAPEISKANFFSTAVGNVELVAAPAVPDTPQNT